MNIARRFATVARAALVACGTMTLVAAGPTTRSGGDDTADDVIAGKIREAQQMATQAKQMAAEVRGRGGPRTFGVVKGMPMRTVWATTAGRREKGAYLGVTATPADAVLREQLKLPRGVGLVVESVEDGSPAAAAGIVAHDVISKVDDQWAIDVQQFGVVVRMHKPGDEMPITLIHQGDPRTATAKLVEKELFVSDVAVNVDATIGTGGWSKSFDVPAVAVPAEVERLAVVTDDDDVVIKTDDRTLKIRSAGGTTHLVVVGTDGHTLFDGPISTPAERKSVPADVLVILDKFKDQIDSVKGNGPGNRRTVRIVESGK